MLKKIIHLQEYRQRSFPLFFLLFTAAAAISVFLAVFYMAGADEAAVTKSADPHRANFIKCGEGRRITCIVDGDTFWFEGTKIRISDINAPEINEAQCAREQTLGYQATDRMKELLNAGPFNMIAGGRDQDKYGRALRIVTRQGKSLGKKLVREGLAETWKGRRKNWC